MMVLWTKFLFQYSPVVWYFPWGLLTRSRRISYIEKKKKKPSQYIDIKQINLAIILQRDNKWRLERNQTNNR